jgi:hypothetical protein
MNLTSEALEIWPLLIETLAFGVGYFGAYVGRGAFELRWLQIRRPDALQVQALKEALGNHDHGMMENMNEASDLLAGKLVRSTVEPKHMWP